MVRFHLGRRNQANVLKVIRLNGILDAGVLKLDPDSVLEINAPEDGTIKVNK